MKKTLLLVFLFVLNYVGLVAQEKSFPFEISGQINAKTGVVQLLSVVDSNYYPKGVLELKGKVLNGKFSIKGDIPYPQAFYLEYEHMYRSDHCNSRNTIYVS